MEYFGPVRFAYVGDREKAIQWTRAARLCVAKLQEAMAPKRLLSARHRFTVAENVTVDVDIAGAQITAVITVPLTEQRDARGDEQFVVWARNQNFPDGIDDVYPQQLLQLRRGEWRTRFFDADIASRVSVAGRTGTYRTQDGEVFFPDGVRHAGNIDWRRADGVRISWYGPSSRYWYDAYVQPRAQYGKKVFMLGQVLLDTEAYIAASDDDTFETLWVMGAALTPDNRLRVIHAYLTPDVPQREGEAPPRTVLLDSPYPNLSTTGPLTVVFEISTFLITRNPDVPTEFRVAPNSRESQGSFTLEVAFNPWFFNEDATNAVTMSLPLNPNITTQEADVTNAPSPSSHLWRLDLEAGQVLPTELSMEPGASSAPCAADYVGNELVYMTMERVPQAEGQGPTEGYRVSAGGWSAVLQRETMLSGDYTRQEVEWRFLKYADLRSNFFVTTRLGATVVLNANPQQITPLFPWGTEYWLDGQTAFVPNTMTTIQQGGVLPDNIANISRFQRRAFAKVPVSPLWPLYLTAAGSINGGTTTYIWARGRSNGYEQTGYRPNQLFGAWANTGAGPAPWARYTDRAGNPNAPADFDGQVIIASGAAFDGVGMYSGTCRTHDASVFLSTHAVLGGDGRQLPSLTGVAGPESRYHPIWLLGTIPR